MHFNFIAIFVAVSCWSVNAEKCPNGGEIFARGINSEGKITVVNVHNAFRLQLANGKVKKQPKASNLKRMKWNDELAQAGKVVSDTCKMKHIIANSTKWHAVGQNLYIEWSSVKTDEQNWSKAVQSWFNENVDFIYPNKSKPGKVTGHYTQVAWADSDNLGCDYIFFKDKNAPRHPYCKLYTCNYGPAGNYIGQAPYKTGQGCEKLC